MKLIITQNTSYTTITNHGLKTKKNHHNPNSVLYGVALAEIIAFVKEQRIELEITVFKLADLIKMYSNRLEGLGLETGNFSNRINSNHLKE